MKKPIPAPGTGKTPRPSKARDAWAAAKKKRRNYVEAHNVCDANNIASYMRSKGVRPAIRLQYRSDGVKYWYVYDTGVKHIPRATPIYRHKNPVDITPRIVAVYQDENPVLPENVQRLEDYRYAPSSIESATSHPAGNKVAMKLPPNRRFDG